MNLDKSLCHLRHSRQGFLALGFRRRRVCLAVNLGFFCFGVFLLQHAVVAESHGRAALFFHVVKACGDGGQIFLGYLGIQIVQGQTVAKFEDGGCCVLNGAVEQVKTFGSCNRRFEVGDGIGLL